MENFRRFWLTVPGVRNFAESRLVLFSFIMMSVSVATGFGGAVSAQFMYGLLAGTVVVHVIHAWGMLVLDYGKSYKFFIEQGDLYKMSQKSAGSMTIYPYTVVDELAFGYGGFAGLGVVFGW